MIVFATNLEPESLADEAFLRRIPYKILAKNPTLDEYCRIFELNCRSAALPFDPVMVEYLLRRTYYAPRGLAAARRATRATSSSRSSHLPLPAAASR